MNQAIMWQVSMSMLIDGAMNDLVFVSKYLRTIKSNVSM